MVFIITKLGQTRFLALYCSFLTKNKIIHLSREPYDFILILGTHYEQRNFLNWSRSQIS